MTTRIRLLNPSIYSGIINTSSNDPMLEVSSYPVVVSAEERDQAFYPGSVNVPFSELNRVFPIVFPWGEKYERKSSFGSDGLTWWNYPIGDPLAQQKSWEEVGPFDFWNELKRSREVGEKPRQGYL